MQSKNQNSKSIGLRKLSANYLLKTLFDGKFILICMVTRVVRRISIDTKIVEMLKHLRVQSFNAFVTRAVAEKLERDFKVKEKCPI